MLSTALLFSACKKKTDDAAIPLDPINGYNNSDEVGAANLKAYWPLDGNGNESKTSTPPTTVSNVTYTAGVKGQAGNFANGYLYYASAIGALTSNQPFTVSAWVQAKNTLVPGSTSVTDNHPYQYFQMAKPASLFGNVNCLIEAGQYLVASDTMTFKSIYSNAGGGTQDNINNYGIAGTEYKVVKKAGTSQWVHVVTTYNPAGGTGAQSIFRIYADAVLVSNTNFENRGSNSFVYSPHEVIIGGWYNNIPGKTVTPDTWTTAFTGKIDEVRVWNKLLSTDEITALNNLGKAGR